MRQLFSLLNVTLITASVVAASGCGGSKNTEALSSSASSSSASSSSSSSSSASSSSGDAVYQAIINQYEFQGINPATGLHKDSTRFRIYYGGNGLYGANNNLGEVSERNLNMALDYLEAAYQMFVEERGFRSPSLSVHSDAADYYKMNIYSTTDLNAGGVMLYDSRAGLSYLEVRSSLVANPGVVVHEFGHALSLTDYHWVNQGRTGAWWETVANWVADTFQSSAHYAAVGAKYGVSQSGTLIDLNTVLGRSFLTIVHKDNLYQAWPFLTYLTNNPDGFPGLGRDAVLHLKRNHRGNNETPLHTLNRLVSPLSAQTVLAHYWARMAYLDIGHPLAQQRLFSTWNDARFRQQAYANLAPVGSQTYQVIGTRQPMYGGSNIIPLTITGDGKVNIQVSNIGNGLPDSNFTAIVAIRSGADVRYELLDSGSGQVAVGSGEEASLVVTNTPDTLYLYDAFSSTGDDPELRGLNYQVQIVGAEPRD